MIRKISTFLTLSLLVLGSYQSQAKKWHFNTVANNTFVATDAAVTVVGPTGPKLGDTMVWHWTMGSGTHDIKGATGPSAGWASFGPLALDASHTEQMYVPNAEGMHGFVCTLHQGTMFGSFMMNAKTSVGNLFTEAGVTISPNPATNLLTIKSGVANPTITLSNIIGKNIGTFSGTQTTEGTTINVANVPSGTYFISVANKDMVITRRIVIAH